MSIEIRQMLIKSQVVQRVGDNDAADAGGEPQELRQRDWRAECRRLINELLDEREER